MASFFNKFQSFFQPLSAAQKALFSLFSVSIITLMCLLFFWALQPSYSVLFGSLSPDSAQTIVEELKTMGVPYELKDNGRSIMVPRNQVYDLRLQFAAEGATGSDYQGYELFDQNTLGMTDFMQRLNKKRALEGELARTINNLSQVENSRIHIVLPERSPFQETTVDPSASVILNLRKGKKLGRDQISGIGALISGSVEGLTAENVVILDQLGNRISENVLVSQEAVTGTAHMKIRQDMETYLTNKGQTMLDRVLGPGNSILRVSTEHNFDKVIRESDMIDPESRTIISEEKRSSTNSDQTQEPYASYQRQDQGQETITTARRQDESTVQVKNYEVNKTREQLEKTVGEITRLSASILLNYKADTETNEQGETESKAIPYSEDEISEIKKVMAGALGVQPDRGDVLTVTQIRFQDPFANTDYQEPLFTEPFNTFELIRWILIAIVIAVVSVMVYRLNKNQSILSDPLLQKNKSKNPELEENEQQYIEGETEEISKDIYAEKLSDEAKAELEKSSQISEEISRFFEQESNEAAILVRSLMNQRGV